MSVQDQTQSSIEVTNDSIYVSVSDATLASDNLIYRRFPVVGSACPQSYFALDDDDHPHFLQEKSLPQSPTAHEIKDPDVLIEYIIGSNTDESETTPPSIPRVPETVIENQDYEKYYVPKVVSIGPYHFGKLELQLFEKRKRVIADKFYKKEDLIKIYKKLGETEMEKNLRSFYEKNSTSRFSAKQFTRMMLLDALFIVYFIDLNYHVDEQSLQLKSNEIFFVRRDLFLLENQIPFQVLKEVIEVIKPDGLKYIKTFIDSNCFVKQWSERELLERGDWDDKKIKHLLGAVHDEHSRNSTGTFNTYKANSRVNFRNVSELVEVGIHFSPIKDTRSLTHIEFVKGWWRFSAKVKLPPIVVSDYTKHMLLNLMAYETCCCSIDESWVTSYVCLLDSLIDDPEDVKILRKAWVLDNFLSSDKDVAELFNELGKDLVPSSFAYIEAKQKMQAHYRSTRNTLYSELKNEYFKNPWAIIVFLGALIALILTGVQTYFAV